MFKILNNWWVNLTFKGQGNVPSGVRHGNGGSMLDFAESKYITYTRVIVKISTRHPDSSATF